MRIIAGQKRGAKLLSPKTQDSRPILDRVKESLFSVLYKYDLPAEKYVADIFSGVGSLGLEALSRGALAVTFVEKDPETLAILKRNIVKLGFGEKAKVIKTNAFNTGAPLPPGQPGYDLVFVDPPYPTTTDVSEQSFLARLLNILPRQLAPKALVVVRTSKQIELLDQYGRLGVIERRVWGTMAITILRNKTDDE